MKKNLNMLEDPDDRGPEIEEYDDDLSETDPRMSRPSFNKIQTPSGSHNTKKVVENQIRDQINKAN